MAESAAALYDHLDLSSWGTVALVALVGCGRLGFDTSSDAAVDAPGLDAADADAAPLDALADGDGAPGDAAVPRPLFTAAATPTIDPVMVTSFAIQGLVPSGTGFCGVGAFANDIVVEGTTRTSVGDDDAWMGCFESDLSLRWLTSAGTRGSDLGGALAVGGGGDVYFRGLVEGVVDFGGGPTRSFGSDDWYVARYESTGGFVAAEVYGTSGDDDFGSGITARDDGTVIVTGGCTAIDFGGGPVPNGGGRDGCLAILDPDFGHVASFSWGGAGQQYITGVAELSADRIVVTADFASTLDLGIATPTAVGGEDAVIFVVSNAGVVDRFWTITGPSDQHINAPVVDPEGNIYVVGSTAGDTDFGEGLRTVPTTDAFVASYTQDGALRWLHVIGGSPDGASLGDDLVLRGGLLYAVGGIHAGATLAGEPVSITGERDGFVACFDLSGELQWSRVFGTPLDDRIDNVTMLSSGELVIGGHLGGTVTLDEGVTATLPAGGTVLAKLSVD